MFSITPQQLIETAKRAYSEKEYRAMKQRCEAAVVEWRWASSLMVPQLPHDGLLGNKPPKWLKTKPAEYGSHHGLDAQGRVVYIRTETNPDGSGPEQLIVQEANGFWWFTYIMRDSLEMTGVEWYEMKGERWLGSLAMNCYCVSEDVLKWKEDQFEGKVQHTWDKVNLEKLKYAKASLLTEPFRSETSYTYSPEGELQRVVERCGGNVEVKYQRLPKGVTLKTVLEKAEPMLVAAILSAVRKAKVKRPIYAIMVQYTGVDTDPSGFAPPLFLPTVELRDELLAKKNADPENDLWMVPEWEMNPKAIKLECENAELDETMHLLFLVTVGGPSSNYGPVRKLFQRACAQLNALDWKGIAPTSDDFIVLPFDTHEEMDRKADFKACVPVEKLRLLVQRGYIPRMKV